MNLLLDTNRYRDFVRGVAPAVQSIQAASHVFIPFIVLAELRAGFAGGNRGRENEAMLSRILQQASVAPLFPDNDTTHHYAMIYQHLRRQGTPIPTHDIWIAALAIQHDLVLFSRDGHFQQIPQLARL